MVQKEYFLIFIFLLIKKKKNIIPDWEVMERQPKDSEKNSLE